MKRRHWAIGAAVVAGVVALVAPAVGQGKAGPAALHWSGSLRGTTLTSYELGSFDGGAHVSKAFRLWNVGAAKSGELAIRLTGSPAFSIALDRCSKKSLGTRWCLVSVAYSPVGDGTNDSATLSATGAHGAGASVTLSGSSSGPAGDVYLIGDGMLSAVPRGGGSVATLATTGDYAYSVAVDATNAYWTSAPYPEDTGTVNAVPIGGGAVTTLATGQLRPHSVAVYGTHVYWLNYGMYPDYNGTVNEVSVGGGSVTTLATGQYFPEGLTVDGTNAYWVDQHGNINSVPVDGGTVTTLVTDQFNALSLATDGTNVYWGDYYRGTVNSVPVGGGAVTTLASREAGPQSVAVDGTNVYWANIDGGSVNEVPIGGGRVRTLAIGQSYPSSVAVDGTNVYWLTSDPTSDGDYVSTVNKVRLGGGRVIAIASGPAQNDLALGP